MTNSKLVPVVSKEFLLPFIIITSLFALWGFANDITNPMVAAFGTVMEISTAKAALIQYTKYAAVEFGKEKIRVNAISPGPFPSLEVQKKDPSLIKRLSKKVSLNRIGKESELRGPVIFLASDASSYVNGANLVVDGGWTAW